MKILGYAMIAVGVGIMTFNGKPRHWEKGAYLKHILIDVGGVLPHGRFLFAVSGYGMFRQMPGNVLLAWALITLAALAVGVDWRLALLVILAEE